MTSNIAPSPPGLTSSDKSIHSVPNSLNLERPQFKLGIYAISKEAGMYNAVYRRDCRITAAHTRVVVICDGTFKDPVSAAEDAIKALRKMAITSATIMESFDILYPGHVGHLGDSGIDDSVKSNQTNEAATLLANALNEAPREWCIWVATSGGSSVLSRAMKILIGQGITLEKQQVRLYRPATSGAHVVRLVHQLGMNMPSEFIQGGFSSSFSSLTVKVLRACYKGDSYTWKDFAISIIENKRLAVTLILAGLLVGYFARS